MHKVSLVFHCDEANGEWGLSPEGTINSNNGDAFNAFWSGIGIFHDVFEHYFEGVHPFFRGQYARNIAGEVVAMGHMAYYYHTLASGERAPYRQFAVTGVDQAIINSTQMYIEEAVMYGNANYGYEYLTKIPYQRPTGSYGLETLIEEHWFQIQKLRPTKRTCEDYDTLDSARLYRKSLSRQKLADCYRYGWRQAKRIAPEGFDNDRVIDAFIQYWDKSCVWPADDARQSIYRIHFTVWTDKGRLRWTAEIELMDDVSDRLVIYSDRLQDTPPLALALDNHYADEHIFS